MLLVKWSIAINHIKNYEKAHKFVTIIDSKLISFPHSTITCAYHATLCYLTLRYIILPPIV